MVDVTVYDILEQLEQERKTMKSRYRKVTALLLLTAILGGCAAREEYTGGQVTAEVPEVTAEQAKLNMIQPNAYNNVNGLDLEPGSYISILGRSGSGAYWEEIKKGMNQAVEDINTLLEYEGSDKVKATYNAADTPDNVDEQVNILDEELARYPVAVGIALSDASACEVQFDLAAENGIPVVAFDSGSDYQGLMSTVSTDNDAAAREAASRMAEDMEDTGSVLILVDNSKAKAEMVRESAFRDEMQSQHPGITIAETCYLDQLETTDPDTDPMEAFLAQYPDITGIFAVSSDAVSCALELSDAMDTDPVIVGFDAEEDEISALSEGQISGLIVQNPYGMGYASVVAAARAALGQGNEAVVNTGYLWVDAQNLKTEEVQRILY